ncbi:MAG TPA: 16S rRNA (uracil(1498)-N(3))-methyltransferase [Nevskiaceae bacterium]|nr:16S rRNA (uracil(1498)-N(3))-methyltransferase [Nevskiaceae bacterium]
MPNRVYVEAALREGVTVALPEAVAHHLTSVLRMRAGEAFVIFNGEGGEFDATLDAISKKSVTARIAAHRDVDRESPLSVTLAQCVSKGERMDYTVQKAAELGATEIVPLTSTNSVVKLDAERWEKKLEHWRGVVVSAAEQSGRTRIPKLYPVTPIAQWLGQAQGAKIILAIGATQSLRSMKKPDGPIALLAGPEGDFSADELRAARSAGFESIGMGPRILRTETAGIAALAAIQALWGDWEV